MHKVGSGRLNIASNGFKADFDKTFFTDIGNFAGNGVVKIMDGAECEHQQQQYGDGNSEKVDQHSFLSLMG
jgi:hypothetical protein